MDLISRLLSLQDHDRKILKLAREVRDIPKRKDEIEERLASHKSALEEAREDVTRHTLKMKELEGDVEMLNQKAVRFREQQMTVKSNDDYRALEREIAGTRKQIRALEDQELSLMEEMERLNSAVATREGELGQEEGAVGEEVQALEKRLAIIEGNANKLKAERPELVEGLEGDWLSRYERIIQHVGDYALVKIERGVCMGCHMTLPPQLVHNAKKRDSITVCSFCGRILFDGQ